jgi:hypothetical protein
MGICSNLENPLCSTVSLKAFNKVSWMKWSHVLFVIEKCYSNLRKILPGIQLAMLYGIKCLVYLEISSVLYGIKLEVIVFCINT